MVKKSLLKSDQSTKIKTSFRQKLKIRGCLLKFCICFFFPYTYILCFQPARPAWCGDHSQNDGCFMRKQLERPIEPPNHTNGHIHSLELQSTFSASRDGRRRWLPAAADSAGTGQVGPAYASTDNCFFGHSHLACCSFLVLIKAVFGTCRRGASHVRSCLSWWLGASCLFRSWAPIRGISGNWRVDAVRGVWWYLTLGMQRFRPCRGPALRLGGLLWLSQCTQSLESPNPAPDVNRAPCPPLGLGGPC